MRLGCNVAGRDAGELVAAAQLCESLGYDSIWRGEAYGGDAIVPLTWAAAHTQRIRLGTAIMQIPARTPAMTAMTAMALDDLSGGRVVLGLGMSGPQVVEGWHGVPYIEPLRTTRECIEIVRAIFRGEGPIEHDGVRYQLPWRGDGSTGLGKPMRPGLHTRSDIPVLIAAIGPKNVALAVEVADGLLPMLWNPVRWRDAFGDALGGVDLSRFDIAPTVPIAIGDDIGTCRDKVRPLIGLYVGGMGARGKNFYNDLVRRYGFEAEAENVQDLYLGGDRKAAVAAVPDRLVDELALVGPREHIAEQLEVWAASGVGTLILASSRPDVLRTMAELAL